MVTSREAPGDIGSQRRRFFRESTVAVQRLDGGGSPKRSFVSAGLRYSPSPPRGGRREDAEALPPLRARRGRVQQVVSLLRVDLRRFLVGTGGSRLSHSSRFFFLSFAGCVAQMVERSLRMRQVLGSMPSASMRERKRASEKGTTRPFSSFSNENVVDPRARKRRLFSSKIRLPGRSQR